MSVMDEVQLGEVTFRPENFAGTDVHLSIEWKDGDTTVAAGNVDGAKAIVAMPIAKWETLQGCAVALAEYARSLLPTAPPVPPESTEAQQ